LVILSTLTGLLLWRGHDFYRQGLVEQTVHADYRALNPAGLLGQGYGVAGTALILSNLLYLVRRRFARYIPAWVGSMKAWLQMHVVTGLSGSILILFHSGFHVRTTIAAVTSGSLAIVVFTGLVGAYIHALVPKAGLSSFRDRLKELFPLLPGLVRSVEGAVGTVSCTTLPPDASLVRTLFTVPRWLWEARVRRRVVRRAARQDKVFRVLAHTESALARRLASDLGDLAASEIDTHAGAALLRSWRSLHRFLALLMILTVTVHIGVAWYYGFRWIFSHG
jgi:hypothetical protein